MQLKISTDKEELTLKNQTHILKSWTFKTLETNKLTAFKEYLKDLTLIPHSIYYDEKSVTAWPGHAPDCLDRNSKPIALCSLVFTDEFIILRSVINDDEISEKGFCGLLKKLGRFGENMITLVDSVENMQQKKIVSMEKSKDSRGNFSYSYSVKDHGAATFTPPRTLKFTIPIFKHINKMVVIQPELSFRYNMTGVDETKQAKLYFKLEMLNLDQFTEESCTAIIESELAKFDCPKYWGSLSISTETDGWKYKDVPMMFTGLPEEKVTNNNGTSRYQLIYQHKQKRPGLFRAFFILNQHFYLSVYCFVELFKHTALFR